MRYHKVTSLQFAAIFGFLSTMKLESQHLSKCVWQFYILALIFLDMIAFFAGSTRQIWLAAMRSPNKQVPDCKYGCCPSMATTSGTSMHVTHRGRQSQHRDRCGCNFSYFLEASLARQHKAAPATRSSNIKPNQVWNDRHRHHGSLNSASCIPMWVKSHSIWRYFIAQQLDGSITWAQCLAFTLN